MAGVSPSEHVSSLGMEFSGATGPLHSLLNLPLHLPANLHPLPHARRLQLLSVSRLDLGSDLLDTTVRLAVDVRNVTLGWFIGQSESAGFGITCTSM